MKLSTMSTELATHISRVVKKMKKDSDTLTLWVYLKVTIRDDAHKATKASLMKQAATANSLASGPAMALSLSSLLHSKLVNHAKKVEEKKQAWLNAKAEAGGFEAKLKKK